MAAPSIDSGAARQVREALIEITNEELPEPEEEDEVAGEGEDGA